MGSAKVAKLSDKVGKASAYNQSQLSQDEDFKVDQLQDGTYSLPDGSCVRLTVFDQGYTHVTIDAKGTLHPMKNNIIETVSVDCP